jgi:hypothetical protein
VIIDNKDNTKPTIAKYGISGSKLNEDGSSKRANNQTNRLNSLVGIVRFIAFVLIKKIFGRKAALEIEQKYTDEYAQKHGGNLPQLQIRPKAKNKNDDSDK